MIKEKFNCPVTSDIHEPTHCEIAKEFLDVIQIPAFYVDKLIYFYQQAKQIYQ